MFTSFQSITYSGYFKLGQYEITFVLTVGKSKSNPGKEKKTDDYKESRLPHSLATQQLN